MIFCLHVQIITKYAVKKENALKPGIHSKHTLTLLQCSVWSCSVKESSTVCDVVYEGISWSAVIICLLSGAFNPADCSFQRPRHTISLCTVIKHVFSHKQVWHIKIAICNSFLKGPCSVKCCLVIMIFFQYVKTVGCQTYMRSQQSSWSHFLQQQCLVKWTVLFGGGGGLNSLSVWHQSLFTQLQNTICVCVKEKCHFHL